MYLIKKITFTVILFSGILLNAQQITYRNCTVEKMDTFLGKSRIGAYSKDSLFIPQNFNIQNVKVPDTLISKTNLFNSPYSKFIIPGTLITYGVLARVLDPLQQLDKSTNTEVGEDIGEKVSLDDYLQFVPSVTALGLGLTGVKAKHDFKDRAITMALSYAVMGITVQTLKTTTKIERPDGSGRNSFPSGHTAAAFLGAQILYREYKDVSLWIPIAGYAVATATGVLRIINQRHWVSDVVTGAGIGMLSAELGYLMLPWFSRKERDNKKQNLVLSPVSIDSKHMGVGMVYSF